MHALRSIRSWWRPILAFTSVFGLAIGFSLLRGPNMPSWAFVLGVIAPLVPLMWAISGWQRRVEQLAPPERRMHGFAAGVATGTVALSGFAGTLVVTFLGTPRPGAVGFLVLALIAALSYYWSILGLEQVRQKETKSDAGGVSTSTSPTGYAVTTILALSIFGGYFVYGAIMGPNIGAGFSLNRVLVFAVLLICLFVGVWAWDETIKRLDGTARQRQSRAQLATFIFVGMWWPTVIPAILFASWPFFVSLGFTPAVAVIGYVVGYTLSRR